MKREKERETRPRKDRWRCFAVWVENVNPHSMADVYDKVDLSSSRWKWAEKEEQGLAFPLTNHKMLRPPICCSFLRSVSLAVCLSVSLTDFSAGVSFLPVGGQCHHCHNHNNQHRHQRNSRQMINMLCGGGWVLRKTLEAIWPRQRRSWKNAEANNFFLKNALRTF